MKGEVKIAEIDKRSSELALGTAFYNLAEKDTWRSILDDFLEYGGTLIDSAHNYGDSEEVIGLWMESRGVRDKIILITKGGHGEGYGLEAENFSRTIKQELTESLEHLRTDYIDLYMLHRDSPLLPVGEIIEYLNTELADGRVHALGASNWGYERLSEANEYAYKHNLTGFAVVSNNISLAVPTAPFYPGLISVGKDGERWHEETGIPLIVWSSQARGFFTGCYSPQVLGSLGQIEDRFAVRMIEIYGTDENFERLRRAKELGQRKGGYSATQIALAWLLHKPFPLIPIVGPHTREELRSCFEATSIKLSESEVKWLNLEAR